MPPQDAVGHQMPVEIARGDTDTRGPGLRPPIEFYEAVLANIGEGVYTVDPQGLITSMNPAAEKLLGWTFEELKGRRMHDATHYKHRDGTPFPAEECVGYRILLEGGTLTDHEDFFIRRDGTFFDVNYSASPIRGAEGIIGWVMVFRDVTDHNRTLDALQELLRQTEQQSRIFDTTLSSITDFAYIFDHEGRFSYSNKPLLDLLGITLDEIIGKNFFDLNYPPELAQRLQDQIQQVFNTKEIVRDETPYTGISGEEGYYEYIFTPVIAPDGSVQNVAGSTRDVTEWRRRGEELRLAHDELEMRVASRTKDLADSNTLLLRQMEERAQSENERILTLKRLFTIQEDERGRIARNIHDQLGQRLTALRLKIASLKDTCADDPSVLKHIVRLEEIAEHLDSEVSFLAWEMRPPILNEINFAKALEDYVCEWSRYSDISAEFNAGGTDGIKLDDEVETNLYRITQEALNNAAKHAGASRINVLLKKLDDSLTLIIEDNGCGFEPSETEGERVAGKGFGLVGMRDRASLISATLQIESAKDKGTTIFVRVPLASN